MMDLSAFAESLKSENCEILINSPMSRQTSFKVGGNAEIIAFPKNEEELTEILTTAKTAEIPFIVIGNGSNLLVRDCGIKGLVIKTTAMNAEVEVDKDIIRCSAGTSLSKLCTTALDHSLTGLEFAYGIPGTVGGAIFMNAGAYDGEIKDVLTSARHITPQIKIEIVASENLNLSYRKSFYADNPNYIITGAEFKLKHGDKNEIKAKMDDLMSRRKSKQPLEYPSAGSTFKRPDGYFAGALIEQCNLKGYRVGGAEVSEKHAGFVINKNSATATDILSLIDHIRKTVKDKTGVTLEPEVKIVP